MNLFKIIRNTFRKVFKRRKTKSNKEVKTNIKGIEPKSNESKTIKEQKKVVVEIKNENKNDLKSNIKDSKLEKIENVSKPEIVLEKDNVDEDKNSSEIIDNPEIQINDIDSNNLVDIINSTEESEVEQNSLVTKNQHLVNEPEKVLVNNDVIDTIDIIENSTIVDDLQIESTVEVESEDSAPIVEETEIVTISEDNPEYNNDVENTDLMENKVIADNSEIESQTNIPAIENKTDSIESTVEVESEDSAPIVEETEIVTISEDNPEYNNDVENTDLMENTDIVDNSEKGIQMIGTDVENQVATISSTQESKIEDSTLIEENIEIVNEYEEFESEEEIENAIADSDIDFFEDDNIEETIPDKILLDENDLSFTYDEVELSQNNFLETIEILKNKLNKNQLIGYDLLQLAGNEELINKIHSCSRMYLKDNYYKTSTSTYLHREEIVISLILIALEKYDGNYWDYVDDIYECMYDSLSEQKLKRMIRAIISYFSNGESRYINYVIRQAIIPQHYLGDFIDICFDIYQNILRCELSNNLNGILADIFISMGDKYEVKSPSSISYKKTYKLIKTTKDIVQNIEWFGELITYTKTILNYVDAYYWSTSIEELPFQEYFKPIFDEWSLKRKINLIAKSNRIKGKQNSWNAEFLLKNNSVILHIPNHFIKNIYEPGSIAIAISNGDEWITDIDRPEINEVTGGYLIKETYVSLDNPLGQMKYEIYSDDDIIYSSEHLLDRNYILFNENNKELGNKGKYTGNVNIIGKPLTNDDKLSVYFTNEFYDLGQTYINECEDLVINGEVLYLSNFETSSLQGDLIDNANIRFFNKTIDFYYAIRLVSLVLPDNNMNLYLQINSRNYHLNTIKVSKFGDKYIYQIDIEQYIKPGFNQVLIMDQNTNNAVFKKIVFVDPTFGFNYTSQGETIKLNIHSCLLDEVVYEANFENEELFDIEFKDKHFKEHLNLVPKINLPIYRVDENKWNLFGTSLSIKDMKLYSKLQIKGVDFDTLVLSDDSSTFKTVLNFMENDHKYTTTCETLLQYTSQNFKYLNLFLYKDNMVVELIRIYYQVVINDKTLDIIKENDGASINFSYDGKDIITCKIYQDGNLCYNETTTDNPAQFKISTITSFETYDIKVFAGVDDMFSMNSSQYEILNRQVTFYSIEDIEGKTFIVASCNGELYNKNKEEWLDVTKKCKYTTVTILNKIENQMYNIRIVYNRKEVCLEMEAELEITSNISEGNFSGTITQDGDLLLFDYKKWTLLFEEDTSTANNIPISECFFKYLN